MISRENLLEQQLREKTLEIERLNNIIKELEMWCNEEMYADDQLYEKVLDKLQELIGSDKE